MSDRLDELLAAMALHIAHKEDITIAEAAVAVRHKVEQVREEYRAVGAPYGDNDDGLYLWLTRPPTAPAA
jgi:hypothetical protein